MFGFLKRFGKKRKSSGLNSTETLQILRGYPFQHQQSGFVHLTRVTNIGTGESLSLNHPLTQSNHSTNELPTPSEPTNPDSTINKSSDLLTQSITNPVDGSVQHSLFAETDQSNSDESQNSPNPPPFST